MNELLNLKQAASAMDCSVSTLRRMIKNGEIKYKRLRAGSPYRIEQSEIERIKVGGYK